jgi:hypothetical protein
MSSTNDDRLCAFAPWRFEESAGSTNAQREALDVRQLPVADITADMVPPQLLR